MTHLLCIQTNENKKVQYIVQDNDHFSNTDYFKNLKDFDFESIQILDKTYKLVTDNIDVDSINLIKYFNNSYEFEYDVLRIMLYFMDPRIENLVSEHEYDLIDNYFSKEINILINSHFQHLLNDIMVERQRRLDLNTGRFENYCINFEDYRGEYLCGYYGYSGDDYEGGYVISKIINNKLKMFVETHRFSGRKNSAIFLGNDDFNFNYNPNNGTIVIKYPMKYNTISSVNGFFKIRNQNYIKAIKNIKSSLIIVENNLLINSPEDIYQVVIRPPDHLKNINLLETNLIMEISFN